MLQGDFGFIVTKRLALFLSTIRTDLSVQDPILQPYCVILFESIPGTIERS